MDQWRLEGIGGVKREEMGRPEDIWRGGPRFSRENDIELITLCLSQLIHT